MTGKQEDRISVTREQLADLLNEDLAREYQAIIAYVVYSQVLGRVDEFDQAKAGGEADD
jgi:hypothetical protein